MNRIVLAYSGSATSSAALAWLVHQAGRDVVTMTLDLGQGQDLATARERALAAGAVRAHVIDVREEFLRDYLLKALHAGTPVHRTPLSIALARPLIARRLVDLARMESASAVAVASEAGSAADVALRSAITALDPGIRVWTPADAALESAAVSSSPATSGGDDTPGATMYADVWSRTIPAAVDAPAGVAFALTRNPGDGPATAATLEIAFTRGLPVRINGVDMSLLEMIESIETIAGAHGVGRHILLEDGVVFESPAATVLHHAQKALEDAFVDADAREIKTQLSGVYMDAISTGRWFSDLRRGIDGLVGNLQSRLHGTVTLEVMKGDCRLLGVAAASDDAAPAGKAVA